MPNDITVKDVVEEMFAEEAELLDLRVPHIFSFRHKAAMDDILYPRKRRAGNLTPKKRIMLITMVIILAAFGITAGAAALGAFRVERYDGYTHLSAAEDGEYPSTVERVYLLSELPEGYEHSEKLYNDWWVRNTYINHKTNSRITLQQDVKDGYKNNFNTGDRELLETAVNGHSALYLNIGGEERVEGLLVWDNGDYILELSGNLTKEELIKLAKSAKI